MLTLIGISYGYCGQCGLPQLVGYFELEGWFHAFPLCARCLKTWSDAIQETAPVTFLKMADLIAEGHRKP